MTKHPVFSLCMPYHNNPRMLLAQYDSYAGFPDELARGLEMVVCDDASDDAERATYPARVQADLRPNIPVRLFRIQPPHIPWSHRVATNIAAYEAQGKWLLVTDIDHVVPVRTWRFLMSGDAGLKTDVAYRFERKNLDGSDYKPHPDSWLFHTSLWFQLGGYDLRYRGHYGQNQVFIERVRRYAETVVLPVPIIRFSRDDIPDASERVLQRKSPVDRAAIARLRRQFESEGSFFARSVLPPYERLSP